MIETDVRMNIKVVGYIIKGISALNKNQSFSDNDSMSDLQDSVREDSSSNNDTDSFGDDCQTNSCLYQSLMTHLSIYILHTLSTYMMYSLLYKLLPFTCTSLIILHKTYLNKHNNTFMSTFSLLFTLQPHIILP